MAGAAVSIPFAAFNCYLVLLFGRSFNSLNIEKLTPYHGISCCRVAMFANF